MAIDDEVRTYQIGLESTRNGITVSIPWAQRQANGAVIVRLHIQSPRHQAASCCSTKPTSSRSTPKSARCARRCGASGAMRRWAT